MKRFLMLMTVVNLSAMALAIARYHASVIRGAR
jgi:hypothetical protein